MAQLIKVNQCVSRYQLNLRCYANRYNWLKKRRMEAWREKWLDKHTIQNSVSGVDKYSNHWKIGFDDWLFDKQVLWSTRTAFERSARPDDILTEQWLRRMLKGINDVSFFMYRPVLLTKSGPVQLDSLLITNDRICCVHPLLGETGDVFQPYSQRMWNQITNGAAVRPLVNPMISLRRTKAVVAAFLKGKGLTSMQVATVVYAPDCYIEDTVNDYETDFVDQRNESEWFQRMDQHSLLMKREQLEAAEALLKMSETLCDSRKD
ncbi:hypothetical protein [Sporolactobacillus nakayamae]|uniref:NERD domain-containing protein n=1 Tax=Sporolactobacillus nakayamae TaxID=269670 RepID=A0A1I2RXF8_9BACL|nr:hypothetical protein [Sporolactobacillus nakayamae]SFG42436.1 hypothetical protein SAMN02982927_01659 [Sporolactobacillus nakayamae]